MSHCRRDRDDCGCKPPEIEPRHEQAALVLAIALVVVAVLTLWACVFMVLDVERPQISVQETKGDLP